MDRKDFICKGLLGAGALAATSAMGNLHPNKSSKN